MIEGLPRGPRDEHVKRLAAIPRESLAAILLRRGIPEDSVEDAIRGLTSIGTPISVDDAVAYPFKRQTEAEFPYRTGRFGDGREYPVYYSALEGDTCAAEIIHHLRRDGLGNSLAYPRFYYLLESAFSGETLDLLGQEEDHPELVSATEAGYPFCQSLAKEARAGGIQALRTRSARAPSGVCFPIFYLETIKEHKKSQSVRISNVAGQVAVDWLTD